MLLLPSSIYQRLQLQCEVLYYRKNYFWLWLVNYAVILKLRRVPIMNRTKTRAFVPMVTFIGGIFLGDMFGQVVPQFYGPVFGVVFGFGFWLSMKLSNSLPDTFPIAVLVSANVCIVGILHYFATIVNYQAISVRQAILAISLSFSPLATLAIVMAIRHLRSRKVQGSLRSNSAMHCDSESGRKDGI
jgi:hypothetical protein